MTYKIQKYTENKAKQLGVKVMPSKKKGKKVDVVKDGVIIASIGDVRYTDFASTGDKERRRLYKLRHEKTRKIRNTPSWWADQLLW
jgi:hypothetical protein